MIKISRSGSNTVPTLSGWRKDESGYIGDLVYEGERWKVRFTLTNEVLLFPEFDCGCAETVLDSEFRCESHQAVATVCGRAWNRPVEPYRIAVEPRGWVQGPLTPIENYCAVRGQSSVVAEKLAERLTSPLRALRNSMFVV